jgi:hypothetical protein
MKIRFKIFFLIILFLNLIHSAFSQVVHKPLKHPKLKVARPPRPGKNYYWRESEWNWMDGTYEWAVGGWVLLPKHQAWHKGYWKRVKAGYVWVPGKWK